MGEAFSSGSGDSETDEEEIPGYDDEDPDQLYLLYSLYITRTVEELDENKEFLVENLGMELDSKKYDLENFFQPGFDEFWEDDRRIFGEIQHLINRMIPEIERQCERISTSTGSIDEVNNIRDEMIQRLEPKIKELTAEIELRKEDWKKNGF
jgi:hypothetical protein